MHQCGNFPPYRYGPLVCNETARPFSYNRPTNTSCVNWNQYYTNCTERGSNPFQGTISFDNIGLAWVAIFLVSFIHINNTCHSSNKSFKFHNVSLVSGHIVGRMDRHNVLRSRRPQFLGLDIFRVTYRGEFSFTVSVFQYDVSVSR